MKKQDLAKFVRDIRIGISKHSPEILTGVGIAGMITTTVLAVKATPKALELIEAAKRKQNRKLLEEAKKNGYDNCEQISTLKPLETVKVAWKPYVPAVVTGVASTVCFIGASSVSARRTAALAAAYQISETALSEYREKVIETIGEKKEQSVRDKVAKEKIEKNPVSKTPLVDTEKGTTLCFDPLSSRYFKSDIEAIRRAENTLNKQLLHGVGSFVSLNEFYDEIGLPRTELGEHVGWTTEYVIDLDISSHLTDEDKPAAVVGHYNPPRYDRDLY